MAVVTFTSHLRRHIECLPAEVCGETLRDVLEQVFHTNPRLRGYVMDDQQRLRQHVVVFIDDQVVQDRSQLNDVVQADSKVYVMQALSGG